MIENGPLPLRRTCSVLWNKPVSSTGYELVVERNGLPFEPGQLVTLHGSDDPTLDREYSICSTPQDESAIHLLYRVIPNGRLTRQLQGLRSGEVVDVTGPHGMFTVRDLARPMVFVATGTGLAPCLSFLRAHPSLDLTVLHGVREEEDLYYREEFGGVRYIPCVSRDAGTPRRVTDVLQSEAWNPACHFYLCGAYEMIVDVQAILAKQGFDATAVFHEAYYYS